MRRDDPAFAVPAANLGIESRPRYFAHGLFGWLHQPQPGPGTGQVLGTGVGQVAAVICPPIGPEYTRAHRTLRHLADRLAQAGIPAVRFDYEGTGDSAGDDGAPGRLEAWRRSIAAAVTAARDATGCKSVCLVGVRLGATLAALEGGGADLLVLWNPVVKGRAYARELQAMAMTSGSPQQADDDAIDSAGFRVSRETLDAIKALDLTGHPIAPDKPVLIVERDDLAGDISLAGHDRIAAAGWNEMMADHQFTVVPERALEQIAGWIARHGAGEARHSGRRDRGDGPESNQAGGITESHQRFGADHHLFGILTRPAAPTGKPTVILLNAGSIHHVGPHRLYVRLARELASRGHPVLRFDFEGIGDSVLRGPGRENHPYEITAMADLQAAITHLRATEGSERFVLVGLCSGAYHVFKAGLELEDVAIEKLIAINPWYFQWRSGLSLDTTVNHYESVAAYRSAARDPQRWKRLLRGEVDMKRLVRVAAAHVAKTAKGRWDDVRETLFPGDGTPLSQDLRRLEKRRRRLHLFQSDGEPAETILATEAGAASRRLSRAGLLAIEHIRGGDHTFSRSAPREKLIERVVGLVQSP
jgi:predicted alpha/beta hydrolase